MAFPKAASSVSEAAVQYAKNLSHWFRDYLTAIKHGRLHPFTPLERKVREATRNEPWGPTGGQLNELTEASMDSNNCSVIFAVLVFRMNYPPEKWRNVYKALMVLEFILKRGSEFGVEQAKIEFQEHLGRLHHFQYVGPDGRDYGSNVRVRAVAVEKLLEDDALLKIERQKLQQFSRKLRGYTRAEMQEHREMGDFARSNSWGGDERVRSDLSDNGQVPVANPNRGAGEMKGVSLEDNKKYIAELKKLLAKPENKVCADCRQHMAAWASINCGVFICLRCSGMHRGLGVHISKVRSCTLDTWLPDQVQFLTETGNAVANAYWEAKLEPSRRPVGDDGWNAFITDKYTLKKFASGIWPPGTKHRPTDAINPSTEQSPAPFIRTASKTALQIGPQKANASPATDLLKFEDEAFAFSDGVETQNSMQGMESADMAEVVAEEAAMSPGHHTRLSFENSALFEQRSSFIRMRSKLSSVQSSKTLTTENVQPKKTPRSERTNSGDVIQTTLLDLDDLESISETMSLASTKMVFPGFSVKTSPMNAQRSTNGRPPTPPEPARSPLPPGRSPAATPAPAATPQQRRPPTPPAPPPFIDLLDAPLSLVPSSGSQSIQTNEDPFGFMSRLEPLDILAGEDLIALASTELSHATMPIHAEPLSQPEASHLRDQPITLQPTNQKLEIPTRLEQRVSPQLTEKKSAPHSKSLTAGKTDNALVSHNGHENLDDEELQSLQDLSKLDQLFVQQLEDFLHFGYNSKVYKKPSYL